MTQLKAMSTGAAQGCVRAPIFLHFLKMKSWLSACRTLFLNTHMIVPRLNLLHKKADMMISNKCVSFERKENPREIWSIRGHSVVQVQPDK